MRLSPGPVKPVPLVRVINGSFYRNQAGFAETAGSSCASKSSMNKALFPKLSFEIPSQPCTDGQHWCIVGPSLSGKTTFLKMLQGNLLCDPPRARTWPYLSSSSVAKSHAIPSTAIHYVGFEARNNPPHCSSTYMAARYESRREITDFSLLDYLAGNTQLNPLSFPSAAISDEACAANLQRIIHDLKLEPLLNLPLTSLSNGQGRRARIARALLRDPLLLLLDEPFMGLDPPTVASLSPLLQSLAEKCSPRVVLTARPQDPVPDWITNLVYLSTNVSVWAMGRRENVVDELESYVTAVEGQSRDENPSALVASIKQLCRGCKPPNQNSLRYVNGSCLAQQVPSELADELEVLVEMSGCQVKYDDNKVILGNWNHPDEQSPGLHWKVRRGDRWGVFGPNGSGKTTLVSLLCSDHPQAYSLPIKLFGRGRLPEPGVKPLTLWDIQTRIGQSSPEVHYHMPQNLSVWDVVASAWAATFTSVPQLDKFGRGKVATILRWFEPELNLSFRNSGNTFKDIDGDYDFKWAHELHFGGLSFSAQRVLLFARAVVKSPDLLILDEAFSGMDDRVRDKCLLFLEHGDTRACDQYTESLLQAMEKVSASSYPSPSPSSSLTRVRGLSSDQALICISHVREEIPDCVRQWLCLPDPISGKPPRFGKVKSGTSLRSAEAEGVWRDIWDL